MTFSSFDGPSEDWISGSEPIDRAPSSDRQMRLATAGPVVSAQGTSGLRLAVRETKRMVICQLTGPFERQMTGSVKDDVPSAPAIGVWYFDTNGATPENAYQTANQLTPAIRVYHPGAFPSFERDTIVALSSGEPGELGIPKYGTGDRLHALFNNQSGRWEVLGQAEDTWRFVLRTSLVQNGNPDIPSMADAYLIVFDAASGRYVTTDVEFPVADFLGIWQGGPGRRGYAKRLADSDAGAGWEVLLLDTVPVTGGEPLPSSGGGGQPLDDCGVCSDTSPNLLQAAFGGQLNGQCSDCDDWYYIADLQRIAPCQWAIAGVGNKWGLPEAELPCDLGDSYVFLSLWRSGPDQITIRVTVNHNGQTAAIFEETVAGTTVDCLGINWLPIIYGASFGPCDWSQATCRVV